MLKISILHPDKLFKAIIVFVFIQMQEIIDNVKLYTYGYCEYVNNHNIFIKKYPQCIMNVRYQMKYLIPKILL